MKQTSANMVCPKCNHSITVETGRNICPHCGAALEFRPDETRRIHESSWTEVLRSSGSLSEESLSGKALEEMIAEYRTWTDPQYADLPDPEELQARLIANARQEVEAAIAAFNVRLGDGTIQPKPDVE